ncbi:MAG: hypothetical protein N3A02_04350 [Rectinema sp.]|nr:hypothetical protein [Rectinema sp.]
MDENTHGTSRANSGNEFLEGLFIGPLDDAESMRNMDEEEARLLHPPERMVQTEESAGSIKSAAHRQIDELMREVSAPRKPSSSSDSLSAGQEAMVLRVASELKSIKQDLIVIKEHFETLRKPRLDARSFPVPEDGHSIAAPAPASPATAAETILLEDVRKLLQYLDRLLESLPEEKIEEFANSEYFELYRTVFEKLGLS